MTADRSLDEFAASDVDEGRDDEGRDDEDREEGGNGVAEAGPATSTSTWNTDGADCERCGETATRRWRDGERLVCAECKEW